MRAPKPKVRLLGRPSPIPASPDQAVLDRVPNPHRDTDYVARFTAPEFTTLCPITGQPDFAHLVIDYVPFWSRSRSNSISAAFATSAAFMKTARLPSASGSMACSGRNGCVSPAIGIRAAAFPSMCFGKPAACRGASGCRTKASHPTAAGARSDGRRGAAGRTSRPRRATRVPLQTALHPANRG